MIHLSLPIKPRIDVRCEYMITPISIVQEAFGKKILSLSDVKANGSATQIGEYIETLTSKLGSFDDVVCDSDLNFIQFALPLVCRTLLPHKKCVRLRVCECGAYEELEDARMFSLRRVENNQCSYCGSELKIHEKVVLMSDITWPSTESFSVNHKWSLTDLGHFLGRQTKKHKISKENEVVRLELDDVKFGVRFQIIWAAMIVYLSQIQNDTDVTIHYVNKVQDKVFFISSLAKVMRPTINIHLKALPIVWLDDAPLISDCSPSQIKLLGKSLGTKRKELHVSLKSWRY
jgi:hypothetical protein